MLRRCLTTRLTAGTCTPSLKPLARTFLTSAATYKGQVIVANAASFASLVEESPKRVMVDFTAAWCGPCRALKPVLKKLIEEQDKVDLVVLDVDEAQDVAQKYQIAALPTIKVFEGGQEVDGFVGNQNFNFIKDFVAKQTAKAS